MVSSRIFGLKLAMRGEGDDLSVQPVLAGCNHHPPSPLAANLGEDTVPNGAEAEDSLNNLPVVLHVEAEPRRRLHFPPLRRQPREANVVDQSWGTYLHLERDSIIIINATKIVNPPSGQPCLDTWL